MQKHCTASGHRMSSGVGQGWYATGVRNRTSSLGSRGLVLVAGGPGRATGFVLSNFGWFGGLTGTGGGVVG